MDVHDFRPLPAKSAPEAERSAGVAQAARDHTAHAEPPRGSGLLEIAEQIMIGEYVFPNHLSETFSGAHGGTRGSADGPDDSADDSSKQGTMLHLLVSCYQLYQYGHGAGKDRALFER